MVAQRIASFTSANASERSQVVWTALLLALGLALIGGILLLVSAILYFDRFASTPSLLQQEVADAVPLLALAFPLILISSVFNGAIHGRQKFGWLNMIQAGTASAAAIVPLGIALSVGPEVPFLFAGIVAVYFVSALIQLAATVRLVPMLKPQAPDWRAALGIASFGGWMTLSILVGVVSVQGDRFAIAAMVGMAAVAAYQVPLTVISHLLTIPAAITSAAFPRAAANNSELPAMAAEATESVGLVVSAVAISTLIAIGPFLYFWIGSQLPATTLTVAYILVAGMWANSLARVPLSVLMAKGRMKGLAILHVAEVPFYLLALYVGIRTAGIAGAAPTWSARAFIDALLVFVIAGVRPTNLKPLVVQEILILALATVSLAFPLDSIARWLAAFTLALLAARFIWRDWPANLNLRRLLRRSEPAQASPEMS